MSIKLQAVYPATQPAVAGRTCRPVVPFRSGSGMPVDWPGQAGKVLAAALIEAAVILGFVLLSLGIGAEGHSAVGSDRPPRLVAPAPAPPPDLASIRVRRSGAMLSGSAEAGLRWDH